MPRDAWAIHYACERLQTGGPAGAPDDLIFGVFWPGFRKNNVIS